MTGGPLAVTEPVIMEIVAGARTDDRESDLRRLLLRFALLDFDAVADFDAAASIYRRCRRAGVTPRGMVDCMIASVALRHRATLLAADVDLNRVATVGFMTTAGAVSRTPRSGVFMKRRGRVDVATTGEPPQLKSRKESPH
jgi:predicted nucleic acid-binding protein